MGTSASLDPVRSAPSASWGKGRIGSALSRDADQADNDFSATLLAMVGHDLRQPWRAITESRPEGLGLGLFIVKHAADLLGHRVEVRSTESQGSCFTVVLQPNAVGFPAAQQRIVE